MTELAICLQGQRRAWWIEDQGMLCRVPKQAKTSVLRPGAAAPTCGDSVRRHSHCSSSHRRCSISSGLHVIACKAGCAFFKDGVRLSVESTGRHVQPPKPY